MRDDSHEGGCCRPDLPATSSRSCPSCGVTGQRVGLDTVKALLAETALCRLELDEYFFCAAGGCSTVYFGGRLRHLFARGDLRVEVWQKEPPGARMICYCFDENEAAIRSEIELHGRSRAVERVTSHVSAQRCACELRNPRGVCCLGDLAMAIRNQETQFNATADR